MKQLNQFVFTKTRNTTANNYEINLDVHAQIYRCININMARVVYRVSGTIRNRFKDEKR